MDVTKRIFKKKGLDPGPLMPTGIVHPEVNDLSLEATGDLLQHLEKAVRIPHDPLHDAMPTLQRIDPSEKVQPPLMLAPSIYKGPASFLGPHTSQLRMQRKTRLVLKENHPSSRMFQRQAEFFLPAPEIPSLLPASPGRTGRPGVARYIPTSSSAAGHAVHGSVCGTSFSNTLPTPPRPIGSEESQPPAVTSTRPRPTPAASSRRIGRVDRSGGDPAQTLRPPDWPCASTSPPPNGSNRRARPPGKTSSLKASTAAPQCESRFTRLAFLPPCATDSPGSIPDGLIPMLSCSTSLSFWEA